MYLFLYACMYTCVGNLNIEKSLSEVTVKILRDGEKREDSGQK